MDDVRLSKLLSSVLRHRPERIGISLDEAGWIDVETLLAALATHGIPVGREDVERVDATSDKQRFALDGNRIRANQGHSVPVALGLESAVPPATLFHGTPLRAVSAIRREGLRPQKRHAVHLSPDVETAHRVGARRGDHVVLAVAAERMHAAGHSFTVSANGVWLVDAVPPEFLAMMPDTADDGLPILRAPTGTPTLTTGDVRRLIEQGRASGRPDA